ncbi:MAG: ribosome biogenesis GTPase Der [Candidatus Shikimatogenerans bostrichidophilus]|nr:MAG: ribosome biogenesis GTPase Der [Candidatus Shikimatogenerans bostrichidophilus]
MKKIISIIGKTNVGKSKLFNCIIRKQRSIVNNEENTTRNRNYGYFLIKNNKYTIIDTGGYIGYIKKKKDIILYNILKQIKLSIKESYLILFVIDIIKGFTYLDKELYLIIKKYNKKFFLVINKIDIKTNKYNYLNYLNLKLDFENFFLISSTHNRGINKLLNKIEIFFLKENKKIENESININIPILGIPNSGKSTFINSLFIDKNKSIVTKKSGTTIDTLYFKYIYKKKKEIYNLFFIDTPGIKKKFKFKKKYYFNFLLKIKKIIKESDICILIIDINKGITNNDLYIYKYIIKYYKGIIIFFNKCDLLKNNKSLIKKKYYNFFNSYIPKFFISCKKGFIKKNINNIKNLIYKIYKNRNFNILTNILNKKLLFKINNKKFIIKHKLFKIKFCYQKKNKLFPSFIFISNLEKNININYKKYIENLIRKSIYNYYGVPIELIFSKNK